MEEILKRIEELGGILDLSCLDEEGQEMVIDFYNYLAEKE